MPIWIVGSRSDGLGFKGAGSNQGRRSRIGRLTRFARGSGGDRSPELCSAAGGRRGWPIRRPRGRFGPRLGSGACPWHAQATGALRGEDWGAGRCERRRWRANAAEFAGASVLGDARGYGPRTLTPKGPGRAVGSHRGFWWPEMSRRVLGVADRRRVAAALGGRVEAGARWAPGLLGSARGAPGVDVGLLRGSVVLGWGDVAEQRRRRGSARRRRAAG